MKRLGLFVFFDPQGIVDDYVIFLLKEMRKVCTELVTVCNGRLTDEGRKRLSEYSETILCRDNTGMDAGALQDYFTHLGSREFWSSFDELVWFNDTCYGPLVPMNEVFHEMEQRGSCDFWGITVHANSNASWPGCASDGIAEHLQSYFIVIKRPLLTDERFYRFWKDMKVSDDFNATVANYELALTRTFASWGYTYKAFCDTRNRDANPDAVCNPTADAMYLLVSQYGCPLIKRKNFIRSNAEAAVSTNGEQVVRTIGYIRKHTQYDTALIYRNLMRLYDQSVWQQSLCLDYTLSAEHSSADSAQKAIILAELDHEDSVRELAEILYAVPQNCELVAVTRQQELVPVIESLLPPCSVRVLPERKPGLSSLFEVFRQIQTDGVAYICILQEVWGNPANGLHIPESSIRFSLYGNLVAGPHFIRNVLDTFEKEPLLGILDPPAFPQNRNAVRTRFDLKEAAKEYNVALPCHTVEKRKVCLSLWCRKEVLLAVLEKLDCQRLQSGSDELEHLVRYIALEKGYYSGEVQESRQAACLLESMRWLVDGFYNANVDLELLQQRRLFQMVAAINSGKCKPEDADVSPAALRKLMCDAVIYWFEKKIGSDISQEKKDTFFLGIRDVYEAYRRVMNAR